MQDQQTTDQPSAECVDCGEPTPEEERVSLLEVSETICRSCHTYWTIEDWETHLAENYANSDIRVDDNMQRSSLIAETKVGNPMFKPGIMTKHVHLLGLDEFGRPLIHRGDKGDIIHVTVPINESQCFDPDQRQIRQECLQQNKIPTPYQLPSPRHAPSGFDPLSTPNGDHLTHFKTIEISPSTGCTSLYEWLSKNESDMQGLSSYTIQTLEK